MNNLVFIWSKSRLPMKCRNELSYFKISTINNLIMSAKWEILEFMFFIGENLFVVCKGKISKLRWKANTLNNDQSIVNKVTAIILPPNLLKSSFVPLEDKNLTKCPVMATCNFNILGNTLHFMACEYHVNALIEINVQHVFMI